MAHEPAADHGAGPADAAPTVIVSGRRPCRLAESVDPRRRDIILDVMWSVEVESEVEKWIDSLPVKEFATVLAAVARQAMRRCIAEVHTAEEDD
ncbi:hypothetical protein [Candidatus Poriferisodalis sp.]|uniref:hypothetical protein n=1 Tax=Candidatus Poriferisodalis sp. TaxID=3101277 RepID=UPI003B518611